MSVARVAVVATGTCRALHTSVLRCRGIARGYEEHEREGYGLPTPLWERALLGVGSALGLLLSPRRGDLLTVLTQVSSYPRIDRLIEQMRMTHEGRCLLVARPSINSQTIDAEALTALPDGTFGREWMRWLQANQVGPDGRCEARHMPTLETRYVIQRYRETHDFYHVLLGMPTNTLGETVVKVFEMSHMHLPVAALSVVGGSARIVNDDVVAALSKSGQAPSSPQLSQLMCWAYALGQRVRVPLISIAWEHRWDQSLVDLRAELGIDEPPPVLLDSSVRPKGPDRPTAHVAGRRFYGWPSRVWERHGVKDPRKQSQ